MAHLLHEGVAEAAVRSRAILAPLLARKGGDPSLRISAVGHAHMDLAWLWPIRETIRKGARTFSTAIELMDRYPDYIFGASQPQYFLWMKEQYPALYAKIKEKVAAGRIEPQGAMWVEADTNVSGGEALVRQLLQGKRFFADEFGVDVRYLRFPPPGRRSQYHHRSRQESRGLRPPSSTSTRISSPPSTIPTAATWRGSAPASAHSSESVFTGLALPVFLRIFGEKAMAALKNRARLERPAESRFRRRIFENRKTGMPSAWITKSGFTSSGSTGPR